MNLLDTVFNMNGLSVTGTELFFLLTSAVAMLLLMSNMGIGFIVLTVAACFYTLSVHNLEQYLMVYISAMCLLGVLNWARGGGDRYPITNMPHDKLIVSLSVVVIGGLLIGKDYDVFMSMLASLPSAANLPAVQPIQSSFPISSTMTVLSIIVAMWATTKRYTEAWAFIALASGIQMFTDYTSGNYISLYPPVFALSVVAYFKWKSREVYSA